MARHDLVVEEDGAPALVFAGASIISPTTRSGNDAHEVATGRFGTKAKPEKPGVNNPPGQAPPDERPDAIRRRDAVVDAARTIAELKPEAIKEFMIKRWSGRRVLEEADVLAFAADVRRQRVEDIIDALDYRIRRGVYGRSGTKKVAKVDFPRGLIRQSLRSLDQNEINNVLTRLRARGWTAMQINAHVVRSFNKDKKMTTKIGVLT